MTETKTVKKNRRSISSSARTTILRFHEKDAVATPGPAQGLFIGHLENVEVAWATLAEDTKGLPSFAGKAVPRLVLRFESNQTNLDERRHVSMTFLPVESNVDTIPGGSKAWQVDNIFTWMKNILDIYLLKGRELTDDEDSALALPFEDFDETNNYIPVEADDVIKGYQVVFENFAAMMNGTFSADGSEATGKKVYFTEKGTMIPLWMKLTRFQKSKNEWRPTGSNGELAFDAFYRTPLLEIAKSNVAPMKVSLDMSKESITPKEVKKAPSIGGQAGMPGMNGGVMVGNMPIGMASNAAVAEATAEEMPF